MKTKMFLSLALLLFLFGCDPGQEPKDEDSVLEHIAEEKIHQVHSDDLEIIVVDGCEYMVFKDHSGSNKGFGFMAHKGNCKNPIHCYNPINVEKENQDTSEIN